MKKLGTVLLVMSLVLCIAAGVSASDKGKATSVNGWVTDTMCGAKDAHAGGEACTKKCMAGGAKMAFVSDADKSVWGVDNPDALKGHEGHHVTIEAHVDAKAKSVHVESVTMMADK